LNAVEIEEAISKLAEQPSFDAEEFPYACPVPPFVSDEAIEEIKHVTISEYFYNPASAQLMERRDAH
jgi:hypothetical protein